MRTLLCALAMVAVMASPALAGGNGTKANATIRVTNNANNDGGAAGAVVIVDPPGGAGYSPTTFDQILNDGGKLLEPGASTDFKVKAGQHTVWAILGTAAGVPVGPRDVRTYSVGKNKTLKAIIVNDEGAFLLP